jgi:hypothetical protein
MIIGATRSGNNSLTDLSGLYNLNSIGGDMALNNNDAMTSLTGLENLTSLGGNLQIGGWGYWSDAGNPSLVSLAALENLSVIGGSIGIHYNDLLQNLSGLENITPGSIQDLTIDNNNVLSQCAILSICEYLVSPNGTVSIYGNAPGCNSQQEVEEACGITGTDEFQVPGSGFRVEVYPNPAEDQVVISVGNWQSRQGGISASLRLAVGQNVKLTMVDLFGREVQTLVDEEKSSGEYLVRIDVSTLPAGVYLVRLQAGELVETMKLMVMR